MDWGKLAGWFGGTARTALKEDRIPINSTGQPELAGYADSAEYYAAMYQQYIDNTLATGHDAQLEFRRRGHAIWGLIAKGADAIPYATAMLKSKHADAREDGAGILAEIGRDSRIVQHVLAALESETDVVARDSLIAALGALKDRAAVPALAKIIACTNRDKDTQWTAIESLGRIVRRRFLDQAEPLQAARTWLENDKRRKP
jgi:hypothetical protein